MLVDVVNLERLAVAILAIAAWPWTFRGVRELSKGKFWPPSFYLSAIFWFAAGAFSFELAHEAQVRGADANAILWWRIVNFSAILLGLICAHVGHRRGDLFRARQFYRMYDHLGEAMAIAELTALDPAKGKAMASECRRLTAAAMVSNG